MLTTTEAFRKFKSRLELNEREQKNASKRQQEVREVLEGNFEIKNSFLTGSYARHTKTKPLEDIDIFFVLGGDDAESYRSKAPSAIVNAFYSVLADHYGIEAVKKQRRSVNVDFGVVVDAEDNTDYRILSIDAVPATEEHDHYEIPDTRDQIWMATNPKDHAELAVEAHRKYSKEWKGLVRMLKYWNRNEKHEEKPVRPSFLIEVMALECLNGGWHGRFDYEIQGFFASLADRIFEEWADPAGHGAPVSDAMNDEEKKSARLSLRTAEREAALASHHAREGRQGESLKAWRALFGPKFPLS